MALKNFSAEALVHVGSHCIPAERVDEQRLGHLIQLLPQAKAFGKLECCGRACPASSSKHSAALDISIFAAQVRQHVRWDAGRSLHDTLLTASTAVRRLDPSFSLQRMVRQLEIVKTSQQKAVCQPTKTANDYIMLLKLLSTANATSKRSRA